MHYPNLGAAIARIKSGTYEKPDIMCAGDSIVAGRSATSLQEHDLGFVGRIRDKANIIFGDTGKGARSALYLNEGGFYSYTGTWNRVFGGCVGFASCGFCTGSSGAYVEWGFDGTGIKIYMGGALAGSDANNVRISIDGGASEGVDLSTVAANKHTYTYVKTGLTSGAHTVRVTAYMSAGQSFTLIGFTPLKGASGIVTHNCGIPGSTTAMWAADTALCTIDMIAPKLTIFSSLSNDLTAQITPEDYADNLGLIVDRALLYGDVLLFATGLRSDGGENMLALRDAMAAVADDKDVGFVDNIARWRGDYAWAQTNGLVTDYVHHSNAGHYDDACLLCEEIYGLTMF